MNDLLSGVLSCIFISIPETAFMVLLLMRFLGMKDLLDAYRFKENIKWYLILIIPPSILMDILNYGIKIQSKGISIIVCLLVLYFLLLYVFKKTAYEDVKYLELKALLWFIPLFVCLVAVDLLTAPVLLYILKSTYIEISKNIYMVLLCSLPSRIIEISLMIVILVNKNNKFQINIFNYIYTNNYFRRYSISALLLILAFEVYILTLIAYNNLFTIFNSLIGQIVFIIIFVYGIPILIITAIYVLISYSVTINSGGQNH